MGWEERVSNQNVCNQSSDEEFWRIWEPLEFVYAVERRAGRRAPRQGRHRKRPTAMMPCVWMHDRWGEATGSSDEVGHPGCSIAASLGHRSGGQWWCGARGGAIGWIGCAPRRSVFLRSSPCTCSRRHLGRIPGLGPFSAHVCDNNLSKRGHWNGLRAREGLCYGFDLHSHQAQCDGPSISPNIEQHNLQVCPPNPRPVRSVAASQLRLGTSIVDLCMYTQ